MKQRWQRALRVRQSGTNQFRARNQLAAESEWRTIHVHVFLNNHERRTPSFLRSLRSSRVDLIFNCHHQSLRFLFLGLTSGTSSVRKRFMRCCVPTFIAFLHVDPAAALLVSSGSCTQLIPLARLFMACLLKKMQNHFHQISHEASHTNQLVFLVLMPSPQLAARLAFSAASITRLCTRCAMQSEM